MAHRPDHGVVGAVRGYRRHEAGELPARQRMRLGRTLETDRIGCRHQLPDNDAFAAAGDDARRAVAAHEIGFDAGTAADRVGADHFIGTARIEPAEPIAVEQIEGAVLARRHGEVRHRPVLVRQQHDAARAEIHVAGIELVAIPRREIFRDIAQIAGDGGDAFAHLALARWRAVGAEDTVAGDDVKPSGGVNRGGGTRHPDRRQEPGVGAGRLAVDQRPRRQRLQAIELPTHDPAARGRGLEVAETGKAGVHVAVRHDQPGALTVDRGVEPHRVGRRGVDDAAHDRGRHAVAQIAQAEGMNAIHWAAVFQRIGDRIERLGGDVDHRRRGDADGMAVVEAAAGQHRARHRRAEIDVKQFLAGRRVEGIDAVVLGRDIDDVGDGGMAFDRLVADDQRLGIDLVVEVERAQQPEALARDFARRELFLGAVPAGAQGVAVIGGDVGARERGNRQQRRHQRRHVPTAPGPQPPPSVAVHCHSSSALHMAMAQLSPTSPAATKT